MYILLQQLAEDIASYTVTTHIAMQGQCVHGYLLSKVNSVCVCVCVCVHARACVCACMLVEKLFVFSSKSYLNFQQTF